MNKAISIMSYIAIALGVYLLGAIIYLFISQACCNSKYKYKITYSHGRFEGTNYTDTFQIQAGPSIKYIDEHNKEIVRYGSFGIEYNK